MSFQIFENARNVRKSCNVTISPDGLAVLSVGTVDLIPKSFINKDSVYFELLFDSSSKAVAIRPIKSATKSSMTITIRSKGVHCLPTGLFSMNGFLKYQKMTHIVNRPLKGRRFKATWNEKERQVEFKLVAPGYH